MLSIPLAWVPWEVMWLIAFGIYAILKGVTWSLAGKSAWRWRDAGYLLGWPGMDADRFLSPGVDDHSQVRAIEWLAGTVKPGLGLGLLWGVTRRIPDDAVLTTGWVGMIGLVMVLHFGLFHLLSCLWRTCGVGAPPLMDSPLLASSVSDFWGRRWNVAFRDLTHRFLFNPLRHVVGPKGALLIGFAVSGVIHDVVISWPAGGGYGGPTVYFLLQGVGLLGERSRLGRRIGLTRGWIGRLFAVVVVIGPVGLLFHRPFIEQIVIPFLHVLGCLP